LAVNSFLVKQTVFSSEMELQTSFVDMCVHMNNDYVSIIYVNAYH
jgi:hypothetical protein